jgi:hypothetical protein
VSVGSSPPIAPILQLFEQHTGVPLSEALCEKPFGRMTLSKCNSFINDYVTRRQWNYQAIVGTCWAKDSSKLIPRIFNKQRVRGSRCKTAVAPGVGSATYTISAETDLSFGDSL